MYGGDVRQMSILQPCNKSLKEVSTFIHDHNLQSQTHVFHLQISESRVVCGLTGSCFAAPHFTPLLDTQPGSSCLTTTRVVSLRKPFSEDKFLTQGPPLRGNHVKSLQCMRKRSVSFVQLIYYSLCQLTLSVS